MKYRIFISSAQREFAKERKAIADYVRKDALFGKHPQMSVVNSEVKCAKFLKGAIEKTGTGTEDMVKQCRSWGLADPEFADGPDFRIVIRRRTDMNPSVNPPVNPPVNPSVNPPVNPPVNQTPNKVLKKNECLVLYQLTANGHLTYSDLAKLLGLHRDTIRVTIAALVKNGLIVRIGSDKTGHWRVVKP